MPSRATEELAREEDGKKEVETDKEEAPAKKTARVQDASDELAQHLGVQTDC
jgi:hypothetical protein